MKVTRRKFNILAGLNLLALPFTQSALAKPDEDDPKLKYTGLFIVQGATDHETSQISVMAQKNQQLNFEIIENETGRVFYPSEIDYEEQSYSPWRVYTVFCDSLVVGNHYDLYIRDKYGSAIDHRQFKSLDHERESSRFALGSCMNDARHKEFIWESFERERPAAVFLLGDLVYGDQRARKKIGAADEKQLWDRHCETRAKLQFYRMRNLIPAFATWDDHDGGLNNFNRQWYLIDYGQKLFSLFFPCDERCSIVTSGLGVGKKVSAFGQNFFLLDGRSFRSEKGAVDETMFGADQERWLLRNIETERVSWLLNGTQWSTPYRRLESYRVTHEKSYKSFLRRLGKTNGRFVFCSGDVHFSEVTKVPKKYLPYETLEFTASSFHSGYVLGMDRFLGNSQRIDSKATRNFFAIQLQKQGQRLAGRVECIGKRKKPIFKIDFNLF